MGLGVPWLLGLTLELGERLVVTGLPGDLDAVDLSPVSKFSGFPKEISDERFARASGDKERSHRSWGCSPRVRSCRPRSEVGEGEFSSECTCRSLDLNGKRTPSERPKLRPHKKLGGAESLLASSSSVKVVAGVGLGLFLPLCTFCTFCDCGWDLLGFLDTPRVDDSDPDISAVAAGAVP